ncbi:hypothetical protein B0H34DRAFT_521782 [Crassisporium funariophilum]|nr:hypothetical protein B0H34DRAFT_521782 [Crassisporium funariophilum]
MTKQVRFAYKNIFHSPAPQQQPQLSYSVSSGPSSSGPITPPSAYSHGLPGPMPVSYAATHPQPSSKSSKPSSSKYSAPVRVHPYLETSALSYNMMDHPSTATRNGHSLSSKTFREPATSPPLPFLALTSQYLPWTIKVYASNGSYVTLEDVLICAYRSLRTNITTLDFNSFPSSNDQRRATRAYEQRYRRLKSTRAYDEEKRGGMKRVDFLMGHSKFLGISNNSLRPHEWHLNVT